MRIKINKLVTQGRLQGGRTCVQIDFREEFHPDLTISSAYTGAFLRSEYSKMSFAVEALPRTPLGELTALSRHPGWWGGGSLLHPALGIRSRI